MVWVVWLISACSGFDFVYLSIYDGVFGDLWFGALFVETCLFVEVDSLDFVLCAQFVYEWFN